MDIKLWLAIIATVIAIGSYFPYIRDIFAQKTRPHIYTWIIWALTQGTAAAAAIYGGGGYAGYALVVGVMLVIFIILLSLKYGTKILPDGDHGARLCAGRFAFGTTTKQSRLTTIRF